MKNVAWARFSSFRKCSLLYFKHTSKNVADTTFKVLTQFEENTNIPGVESHDKKI